MNELRRRGYSSVVPTLFVARLGCVEAFRVPGAPYGNRTRITAVKETLRRPWSSTAVRNNSINAAKTSIIYSCTSNPVQLHLCRTFAVRIELGMIGGANPS
jgi:hypothetical protein